MVEVAQMIPHVPGVYTYTKTQIKGETTDFIGMSITISTDPHGVGYHLPDILSDTAPFGNKATNEYTEPSILGHLHVYILVEG